MGGELLTVLIIHCIDLCLVGTFDWISRMFLVFTTRCFGRLIPLFILQREKLFWSSHWILTRHRRYPLYWRLVTVFLNCRIQSISLYFLLRLCWSGLLGAGKETSFGVMVSTVSIVLVLHTFILGRLGGPTRIFFVVKDWVFIIGGRGQLLILLVEEGHPVYCVASPILMVLIEIDSSVVLLRCGCGFLFGFLQRHIWLAFLYLMKILGPFFLTVGLLFSANLDSTGSCSSTRLVRCIWRITLLTNRWRASLQDRYSIFLTATVHLLVPGGLDADGILRYMGGMSGCGKCSPLFYCLFLWNATG